MERLAVGFERLFWVLVIQVINKLVTNNLDVKVLCNSRFLDITGVKLFSNVRSDTGGDKG